MAAAAQKQVAITIDDIQQEKAFLPEDYRTGLLDSIHKLKLPVAALISEGRLFKGDTARRFRNTERWLADPLVTPGSHTYSHLYYSDTTYDFYIKDIEKGLAVSKPLARKQHKQLHYLRFPFNCLGKDSLQHQRMRAYLQQKKLTLAPFSVESEDWAYSYVYEYHLSQHDSAKAEETARRYVQRTLTLFRYMDSVSQVIHGRSIKHIYLCHDNLINEHYLPVIVRALKQQGYSFISLDAAMKDPVYHLEDRYYKKWGISWLYRPDYDRLKIYLKGEPDDGISAEYEQLDTRIREQKKETAP